MTTTLTAMARAYYEKQTEEPIDPFTRWSTWDEMPECARAAKIECMRAAVEAARDLPDAMAVEISHGFSDASAYTVASIWTDGCKAILEEHPQ